MVHKSVPIPEIEIVDLQPLEFSPLISKCQIKVCYVGDKPNRNGSIITKEVAQKYIAPSLRGNPIVGYFNEASGDFEEHNRQIDISNGEFRIKDVTRPYGYIDSTAKVWFQKFIDDGVNEHEYLMTEGYLWTGQYPEARRVIEHGNNQSMELDEEKIKAEWTKDDNGNPQFFIINEAIISKLCILGEGCEPCFEGSSITRVQFSLDDNYKEQITEFVSEMKEILSKGGTQVEINTENELVEENTPAAESEIVDEALAEEVEFKKKEDEEEEKKPEEEEKSEEGKEEKPSEDKSEEEGEEKEPEEEEDDDKKKKKYSLDEIVEYTELQEKYDKLEAEYTSLLTEVSELREFKLATERENKQEMIDKFCLLSDEDKKDVVENIDKYSLDEIEAKLSVIYVRNGLSFAAAEQAEEKEAEEPIVYNFDSHEAEDDAIPAWVKAVLETEKTLN